MAPTVLSNGVLHHEATHPICETSGNHANLVESPLDPAPNLSTVEEGYLPSELLESSCQSLRTLGSESLSNLDEAPKTRVQPLSTTRLVLAHIGAALTLFLATTDATIVSTSLPTITNDLHADHDQYTWVGIAYMLTQTACQPLYGRISDLVGRKNILWTSMAVFAIGSLLCGSAQTIVWLIGARALAGVGGGGIVSSVWVITSEIVDVRSRAKWSQALSITWCCSAIAGPLLGGLFSSPSNSGNLSWRWGFYMNIPISLFAFVILFITLHNVQLGPSHDASWQHLWQKFDFIGLVFFMGGSSCIVVGFSFAGDRGWSAPSTLSPMILGLVVLVCGGLYEVHTNRDALFPATSFIDLTIGIVLIITFLHNFAFSSGTFYLALYFQAVDELTPLQAGIRVLPYSLGSSLASMPVAWFISFLQKRSHDTRGQKGVICFGLIVSTFGFGLMNRLDEKSSGLAQSLFPLIAGIGLGMLFHAPYQVFIKTLKPRDIATGTSAFFLVRFTGATIGLSVAGALFNNQLGGSGDRFGQSYLVRHVMLRPEDLHVVSSSIQTVWALCSPCLGLAFLISMLLRIVPIEENDEPYIRDKPTK